MILISQNPSWFIFINDIKGDCKYTNVEPTSKTNLGVRT